MSFKIGDVVDYYNAGFTYIYSDDGNLGETVCETIFAGVGEIVSIDTPPTNGNDGYYMVKCDQYDNYNNDTFIFPEKELKINKSHRRKNIIDDLV